MSDLQVLRIDISVIGVSADMLPVHKNKKHLLIKKKYFLEESTDEKSRHMCD